MLILCLFSKYAELVNSYSIFCDELENVCVVASDSFQLGSFKKYILQCLEILPLKRQYFLIIMPILYNIDYITEIFPNTNIVQTLAKMLSFIFSFGMSLLRIFTGLHFKLNWCNIRFKYWIYMAKCIAKYFMPVLNQCINI